MLYMLKYWKEVVIIGLIALSYIMYQKLKEESIATSEITRAYQQLAIESSRLQERIKTDVQIVTVTEKRPDGTKTTTKTETKKEVKETAKEKTKTVDKQESVVQRPTRDVSKYSVSVYYRPWREGVDRVQGDVGMRLGVLPLEAVVGGSSDGVYLGIRYSW